jgi:hypothetical protein
MYGDELAGPAPAFPDQMEQRITRYLSEDAPVLAVVDAPIAAAEVPRRSASPAELEWLLHNATVFGPIPTRGFSLMPLTAN